MKRTTIIRTLWHWHRRLGLVACILILLLSITGIMLNHSPDMGWDQRQITWKWILGSYGFNAPDSYQGLAIQDHYWVMSGNQIFRDGKQVEQCVKPWLSIVHSGDMVVAACAEKVSLFEADGELLETLSALPETGLQAIGMVADDARILLQFAHNQYFLDVDSMELTPTHEQPAEQEAMVTVPLDIANQISNQFRVNDLTWERFVLDIHAGRWFGGWGWVLMDLGALFMLLLALSGVFMYLLRRTR